MSGEILFSISIYANGHRDFSGRTVRQDQPQLFAQHQLWWSKASAGTANMKSSAISGQCSGDEHLKAMP
jgi:hypothetical protein